MTFALEIALVTFVVLAAVAAALLRDVLGVIVVFASFSLGLSIIWIILSAPDVALTEAAVGAGVMSVLLLLTISKTARPDTDTVIRSVNYKAVAVVGLLFVVLLATVPALPEVGSTDAPAVQETVDGETTPYGYYVTQAYDETGVENAVSAILVFYRGFDTFGEGVVVFSALVGMLVVFRTEVLG